MPTITRRRDLGRVNSARPSRIAGVVDEVETMCRQESNELLFFRSEIEVGEDVYVGGRNESAAAMFVAVADTEARGPDSRLVDDTFGIPA